MKKITYVLCTMLLFIVFQNSFAQPTPPNGKKWEKIEAMSDEFNSSSLNTTKWDDQDPQWQGRRPARFEKSSVKVGNGNLQVIASKKSSPSNGWTHNGGLVRSKTKNTYGYYEARMKANKTFMSSTFWLFNKRNEHTGCDVRTTELDVTENIGLNTGGQSWINRNIVTINSNTHSRGTSCNSTPKGIKGAKSDIGEPAYAGYHTYGVWWKGPKELLFYLDGKLVHQITPVANFNLGMYLRMVVETYDWNPPKGGQDGMNDSQANRTTYYDWVRSYKLVNCNSNCGNPDPDPDPDPDPNPVTVSIDCNSLPSSLTTGTSIEVPVSYTADQNRDVVVELWNSGWLAQGKKTVSAGSGTTTVTINLNNAPAAGSNYLLKASVRPVGAGWQQNIDACNKNNITLSTSAPDPEPDPDPDPVTVSIDCNSLPSSLTTGTSIEVPVSYTADQNRDVVVELWNSGWLAQGRKTVGVGSGTTTVTINLNNAPAAGSNYLLKASVRPVGTGWQQNIESCSKNNITLTTSGNSGGGGAACNTSNTVTGLNLTGNTNNSATIAFNQLSGVNTYELRAFNKGAFNGNINNGTVAYKSGSSSPLTISGLNAGTEYTFVIRALCNSGGPTPTSQVNASTSGTNGNNGGSVGDPDNGGDTGCTGKDTFDQGVKIVPNANSWKDSYKANGYCFCSSSFDHGVGNFKININGKQRNIRDICDELKKHPKYRNIRNGDARYNDIQCGNGPRHGDAITIQGKRIKDEKVCPGRVDQGSKGCNCKGPEYDRKWLEAQPRFGGNGKGTDIFNSNSFSIYPNPASAGSESFLNIYSEKSELAEIKIHDLSGRVIGSMNHNGVEGTTSAIEITNLIKEVSSSIGVYIISYKTKSISISKAISVK